MQERPLAIHQPNACVTKKHTEVIPLVDGGLNTPLEATVVMELIHNTEMLGEDVARE